MFYPDIKIDQHAQIFKQILLSIVPNKLRQLQTLMPVIITLYLVVGWKIKPKCLVEYFDDFEL